MRCPSCQNENAVGAAYCDMCGFDLSPPQRAPVAERAPAPLSPQPANPHQKRHTVFEPDPAAPPPPAPQRGADFFANPPPPRPTFDPRDPFAAASLPPSRPVAAPAPAVMPPAPAPAAPPPAPRPKARTIVESSNEGAALGRIRGALFEYRGPTDPGRVHPLRVGRNVLGRGPECDVMIEDGRVSGQHAFLFIRAEDASYMDVSSNGSLVNGAVVHGEQVVLQNHAVLTLGGTTLVLVIVPEPLLARRSP
jgi:Inner membrane component of T3SS, cytoplasmic domain